MKKACKPLSYYLFPISYCILPHTPKWGWLLHQKVLCWETVQACISPSFYTGNTLSFQWKTKYEVRARLQSPCSLNMMVGVSQEHPLFRMAFINRGEYLGWLEKLTCHQKRSCNENTYEEPSKTRKEKPCRRETEQLVHVCLYLDLRGKPGTVWVTS